MASETAPEVVVARLRPHARILFWPSLLLVLVAGTAPYLAGQFREQWQQTLIGVISAAFILVGVLLPYLSWLSRNYTITTRRIVLRGGVLVRTRQEILHSRSYDVTVRQSGGQLMFGSGDIRINTGLEHPVVLSDVPAAALVQAALHDLMEGSLNPIAARRQLGESG